MSRFLLMWPLLMALGASAAETITIRSDVWAPYNTQPGSDHPGITIELITEIYAAQGIAVDYQIMPWARAIQGCKAGEIDSIVGATGLEFPGIVVPAQPLAIGTCMLIGLADQPWRYQDLASLDRVKVSYPRGYNYATDVDEYLRANAKGNVTEIGGEEPLTQAVAMLERRRVDAYVEDELVFFSALPVERRAAFRTLGALTKPIPMYLCFSPAKPSAQRWAALLDAGLIEAKRTGRYAAILARYGITLPANP